MTLQALADASSMAQLFGLTFSGVTFITVITATWRLSATLATFGAQLSTLTPLGEKVTLMEREVALMKQDMNNLWKAHREYCERKDREGMDMARFLEEWDAKRERDED